MTSEVLTGVDTEDYGHHFYPEDGSSRISETLVPIYTAPYPTRPYPVLRLCNDSILTEDFVLSNAAR
jgi:hypothetical protein